MRCLSSTPYERHPRCQHPAITAPDLLFGFGSDPHARNVLGIAAKFPQLARQGVNMRRFGQELIGVTAGKKIHGTGAVPGAPQVVLSEGGAGKKVLLLGIGNPCRGDDGLGPALAARFEAERPEGVEVDINYQLNVEDALKLKEFDVVVLLDAAVDGDGPFYFREVEPAAKGELSTHSVAPESVAAYARELFEARGRLYVLGIRGADFSFFEERLTAEAAANLELAEGFLREWLAKGK